MSDLAEVFSVAKRFTVPKAHLQSSIGVEEVHCFEKMALDTLRSAAA